MHNLVFLMDAIVQTNPCLFSTFSSEIESVFFFLPCQAKSCEKFQPGQPLNAKIALICESGDVKLSAEVFEVKKFKDRNLRKSR